ncbi:myosin-11-like [Octopus sinensis]|uniref:Myosin-11-like n=1 Tax=Octopus sinensis TaxID=2607531 RepID=A0A7E6EXG2_9MOLL|nr:myosin-11-like [Octopus sinensis]
MHQQRRVKRTYLSHTSMSFEELKHKESELADIKAQLESAREKKIELQALLNELEKRLRILKDDCKERVQELEAFITEYGERLTILQENIQSLENKKRDLTLEIRLIHEHQDYFRKSLQAEAEKRLQYYRENKLKAERIQKEALGMSEIIEKLGNDIKMFKEDFKRRLTESAAHIIEEQAGIDEIEETKENVMKVVLKRIPSFKRLQVKHYKVEKLYNTSSKMFTYISQKEAIIEDEVKFAARNLESKKKKLAQWNARIENNRKAYIKALIVNANKIECIEENIYSELNKIRAIMLINSQLREALEEKEIMCKYWQQKLDNDGELAKKLQSQVNELRELLQMMRKMTEFMVESTQHRELNTEEHLENISETMASCGKTMSYIYEKIYGWLQRFEDSFGEIEKIKES